MTFHLTFFLLYLYDIYDEHGPKNIETIAQKIGSPPAIEMLNYNIVINAIPKEWKNKMRNVSNITLQNAKEKAKVWSDNTQLLANASTRIVRHHIVRTNKKEVNGLQYWNRIIGRDISPYLMTAEHSTKESSLRLLQFKIIHNIIATNVALNRWKLKDTNKCDACNELDTVKHMFARCRNLNGFWDHVTSLISRETKIKINLSTHNIILGVIKSDHPSIKTKCLKVINEIILIAKFSINKMRFGEFKNVFIIFDTEYSFRKGLG